MLAASARRLSVRSAQKEKLGKWSTRVTHHAARSGAERAEKRGKLEERMRRGKENAMRAKEEVVKKARKEDQKVSEVAFIQELTTADFEQSLKDKLNAVEARITSARNRQTAARLLKVTTSTSRRTRAKGVMTEREGRRVEETQERWEMMQGRIKAVGERREVRLGFVCTVFNAASFLTPFCFFLPFSLLFSSSSFLLLLLPFNSVTLLRPASPSKTPPA